LNLAKNCKTYLDFKFGCGTCHKKEDNSHVGNFIFDDEENCVPMEEIKGCVTYDLNNGKCLSCDAEYFEKDEGCVPYPQGVRFCEEFQGPRDCLKCISDYYLDTNDGTCKNVFTPIDKCEKYSSATECQMCLQGWMLNADNTECVETHSHKNCLEFLTYDSCSSCPAGLALVETELTSSDGTNKIKKCESKIENCIKIIATDNSFDRNDVHGNTKTIKQFTYTCEECKPGYLPSSDLTQCTTVPLISNCLKYSRKDKNITCSQCNPGFWRSKDMQSCVEDDRLNETGCENAHVSNEIKCNLCKPGFMMNYKGNCIECGGEGCAICDKETSSKCALCSGGYYMNSQSKCIKSRSFSVEKESVSGGDPINVNVEKVVAADEGGLRGYGNFMGKVSMMVMVAWIVMLVRVM
jgi:hypothetical protein